MSKGVS